MQKFCLPKRGASDNIQCQGLHFADGETEARIPAPAEADPAQALGFPVSPAPAPLYPGLSSTAQTRWVASVLPATTRLRRYVNCEAQRKCTSHLRRRTPGLTGRRPAFREPHFHLRPNPGVAAARISSRSALRPPATRDRPQPILTRADQGHGAVAAFQGSSHRAPGSASEPPRATSGSPLLPARSAKSGEQPRRATLA